MDPGSDDFIERGPGSGRDGGSYPWRLEKLERALDALAERGDRRHDENQKALGTITSDVKLQTQAIQNLAVGLIESRDQSKWLMRSIAGLSMIVIAAFAGLVIGWLRDTMSPHDSPPSISRGQ